MGEGRSTNHRSNKMSDVEHFNGLDDSISPSIHTRSREDTRGDLYMCTSSDSSSSTLLAGIVDGKECSMCGDVGIYEDLFQCKRCLHRYQHLYCSRSYPDFGLKKWVCDWCLHTESRGQPKKEERIKLRRKTASGKSHALEVLLQIAQSLPEAGNQEDKVDPQKSSSIATNVLGGQVPKRQRCNHVAEKNKVVGIDRWRQVAKKRLQLNPSKGTARRYKLLADVLC